MQKVHDENIHITPNIGDNFPEPDLPADEAWEHMKALLDEDSQEPSPPLPPNYSIKWNNFWNFFLIICAIFSVVTCWWLFDKKETAAITPLKTKLQINAQNNIKTSHANNNTDTTINISNNNPSYNKQSTQIAKLNDSNLTNHKINDIKANTNTRKELAVNNTLAKNYVVSNSNNRQHNYRPKDIKDGQSPINESEYKIKIYNTKNSKLPSTLKNDRQMDMTLKKAMGASSVVENIEKHNTESYVFPLGAPMANEEKFYIKDLKRKNKDYLNKSIDDDFHFIYNQNEMEEIGTRSVAALPAPDHINIALSPFVISDSLKTDLKNKKTSKGNKKTITKKENSKLSKKLGFGLQWKADIPLQSNADYLIGSSNKRDVFKFLIPGIWASKRFNSHEIIVLFNLYQQNFINNQTISSFVSTRSLRDTNSIITTTNLNKTFGMSGRLQYNYFITPSFTIGAGIQYNTQEAALQSNTITGHWSGEVIYDTAYTLKKSSADWTFLNSNFFTGIIEVTYRRKKLAVGVDFQAPFTNLSSSSIIDLKPISANVFFRWKIK